MNPTDPNAEYDRIDWRVQMALDIESDSFPHEKVTPECTLERTLRAGRVWYAKQAGGYQVVPSGMVTDGASIPRLFLRIFHRDRGRHWRPALMHDHYYGSQPEGITRAIADRRFLDAMEIYGVPAWGRWTMYLGLRLGGWIAWRKNGRKLHTDPTIKESK
jgi:hypothetical protein